MKVADWFWGWDPPGGGVARRATGAEGAEENFAWRRRRRPKKHVFCGAHCGWGSDPGRSHPPGGGGGSDWLVYRTKVTDWFFDFKSDPPPGGRTNIL